MGASSAGPVVARPGAHRERGPTALPGPRGAEGPGSPATPLSDTPVHGVGLHLLRHPGRARPQATDAPPAALEPPWPMNSWTSRSPTSSTASRPARGPPRTSPAPTSRAWRRSTPSSTRSRRPDTTRPSMRRGRRTSDGRRARRGCRRSWASPAPSRSSSRSRTCPGGAASSTGPPCAPTTTPRPWRAQGCRRHHPRHHQCPRGRPVDGDLQRPVWADQQPLGPPPHLRRILRRRGRGGRVRGVALRPRVGRRRQHPHPRGLLWDLRPQAVGADHPQHGPLPARQPGQRALPVRGPADPKRPGPRPAAGDPRRPRWGGARLP